MKFLMSEDQTPLAEDDGELSMLADFLTSDIQGDKAGAIDLLQFLERKSGERVGNAFALEFGEKSVRITPLYSDEDPQEVSRVVFFQAVEAWIVFISD